MKKFLKILLVLLFIVVSIPALFIVFRHTSTVRRITNLPKGSYAEAYRNIYWINNDEIFYKKYRDFTRNYYDPIEIVTGVLDPIRGRGERRYSWIRHNIKTGEKKVLKQWWRDGDGETIKLSDNWDWRYVVRDFNFNRQEFVLSDHPSSIYLCDSDLENIRKIVEAKDVSHKIRFKDWSYDGKYVLYSDIEYYVDERYLRGLELRKKNAQTLVYDLSKGESFVVIRGGRRFIPTTHYIYFQGEEDFTLKSGRMVKRPTHHVYDLQGNEIEDPTLVDIGSKLHLSMLEQSPNKKREVSYSQKTMRGEDLVYRNIGDKEWIVLEEGAKGEDIF